MKTFETTGTVTAQGTMTVAVPGTLGPGTYHVVLVLDEQPDTFPASGAPQRLSLPAWPWNAWPSDATFRREDIYGDDGH